ncbi:MAG TPA: sigma-70 family RNA polymerase sigma factor [Actinomycetota bacterium]|nr:sigma-70 family RNA polymerase sigma factor [Actinomycetota bacterium]
MALDEATIRAFLEDEYPQLVAAVTLASGSRAAAEDAVCEALSRAWERSERGERIESLGAWVTTVAMNLVRSRWRRILAERRARARMDPPRREPPDAEAALDLRRALAGLSSRQREVVVLRYYLGHDVGEVARLLAVSEGTVKTTLHRARRSLARTLGAREDDVVGS